MRRSTIRRRRPKEASEAMSRLYEPYIRKRDDLAEEQRRSCQGGSGKRVADAVFTALLIAILAAGLVFGLILLL